LFTAYSFVVVVASSLTLHVVAVLFCATLVRSAFGFGEALIAVPLLALALPVETAAPVAVMVSITVAAIVVAQDWRDVQVPITVWLVLSSMAGIPLGLLLLRTVSEPIVKGALGVIVGAFATASLLNRGSYALKNDRLVWLFGVAAGILGGAYGMNGPPLVVYGALRRWSPGCGPRASIATTSCHCQASCWRSRSAVPRLAVSSHGGFSSMSTLACSSLASCSSFRRWSLHDGDGRLS
jgi:uncharacterized membrane protein YfcA